MSKKERLEAALAKNKISIGQHAINKLLDWRRTGSVYTNQDAKRILTRAVREGEITQVCPGGAIEIVWHDLYLVVKCKQGEVIVLTVNGDTAFRNWFYQTHVRCRFSIKAKAAI